MNFEFGGSLDLIPRNDYIAFDFRSSLLIDTRMKLRTVCWSTSITQSRRVVDIC